MTAPGLLLPLVDELSANLAGDGTLVDVKDRIAWISALSGIGLVAIGATMYYRERKALSGVSLGRTPLRQAPAISSYSDGNMRTTMRASPDMPIEERIATLQDLVHKGIQDPEMRKLALQITSRCPERDKVCEARAVYSAVKRRVRYTGDVGPIKHPTGEVEGVDLYQHARRTWEFGGGDCDDNSVLNATLLALNGLTPVFRVVKQRSDPDWSHIYTGFMDAGKFIALDTTLPGSDKFGVEAPYHKRQDFPA